MLGRERLEVLVDRLIPNPRPTAQSIASSRCGQPETSLSPSPSVRSMFAIPCHLPSGKKRCSRRRSRSRRPGGRTPSASRSPTRVVNRESDAVEAQGAAKLLRRLDLALPGARGVGRRVAVAGEVGAMARRRALASTSIRSRRVSEFLGKAVKVQAGRRPAAPARFAVCDLPLALVLQRGRRLSLSRLGEEGDHLARAALGMVLPQEVAGTSTTTVCAPGISRPNRWRADRHARRRPRPTAPGSGRPARPGSRRTARASRGLRNGTARGFRDGAARSCRLPVLVDGAPVEACAHLAEDRGEPVVRDAVDQSLALTLGPRCRADAGPLAVWEEPGVADHRPLAAPRDRAPTAC